MSGVKFLKPIVLESIVRSQMSRNKMSWSQMSGSSLLQSRSKSSKALTVENFVSNFVTRNRKLVIYSFFSALKNNGNAFCNFQNERQARKCNWEQFQQSREVLRLQKYYAILWGLTEESSAALRKLSQNALFTFAITVGENTENMCNMWTFVITTRQRQACARRHKTRLVN